MHIDWHEPLILLAASESLFNFVICINYSLENARLSHNAKIYEGIGYKVLLFYTTTVVKNLIAVKAQQ